MANTFPGVRYLLPLFSWATESPAECAQVRRHPSYFIPMNNVTNSFQVMWWRVWGNDPNWKTGAHEIDHHGNSIGSNKFVTPEAKKAIWEHALKITS